MRRSGVSNRLLLDAQTTFLVLTSTESAKIVAWASRVLFVSRSAAMHAVNCASRFRTSKTRCKSPCPCSQRPSLFPLEWRSRLVPPNWPVSRCAPAFAVFRRWRVVAVASTQWLCGNVSSSWESCACSSSEHLSSLEPLSPFDC